ncbi:MAG: hypothetical protein JWR04_285 [Rhodoglobus sp.]|nr:hypothetical protein [Rhodoglobus sp.]
MSFVHRGARRRGLAGALAALVIAVIGLSTLAPAAAHADPGSLFTITKSVDKAVVLPGQTFTYTITVDCSPEDCPDARLVDDLPDEFADLTVSPNVIVTGGPSTATWSGSDSRTLTVDFQKPLTDGGVGIASGSGYSVQVALSVPAGLSPDWAYNGTPITNTARASSVNAPDADASRDVTINVPVTVSTTAAADWTPASTRFKVGEASALLLTTRNTSNAKATSLTLVVPTDPTAVTNPFEAVDFTGFGAVTFPGGADRVQVDAYVAGAWVAGSPDTAPVLPGGVVEPSIRGLRFSFTSSSGSELTANGLEGSVVVQLAQRATIRTSGASLVTGTTAVASVTGTVLVPGQPAKDAVTSDSYVIDSLDSKVTGATVFAPARIPAGTESLVSVTGQNASKGTLDTLTITEPSTGLLADSRLAFDGFRSAGSAWPSGASSATVTWVVDGGTTPSAQVYTSGVPSTPALVGGQRIIGFSIEYSGDIAVNALARAAFAVDVDGQAAGAGSSVFLTDAPSIGGTNDAGSAAPATPTAALEVLAPAVAITLDKVITPSAAVPAGGRSLVQLTARASSDTGYVAPDAITVIDEWTGSTADYWAGFDAVAISSTAVSVGSTLVVSYKTTGGWVVLDSVDATASAQTYRRALPTPTAITGLKFVFTKPGGYALGSVVRPTISFQARSEVRGTTDPTAAIGTPVTYTNAASAVASGSIVVAGVTTTVDSTATDTATGAVKAIAPGVGGALFDKTWQAVSGSTAVDSQSGQTRVARLAWGTEVTGYDSATVQDPVSTATPVDQTVFQAFNLTQIKAVTTTTDPQIAWDRVTAVELFNKNTQAWEPIGTCTPAHPCEGGLPVQNLSAAQQESTIGVRVTFAPNDAARTTDPLAPPVGSGVASGPDARTLDLVFQVRNQLRDTTGTPSAPWVTQFRVYNNVDNGSVLNTGSLALVAGGTTTTASDSDELMILDDLPQVSMAKSAANSSLVIPNPDDVAVGSYPTSSFTVRATNDSNARAWFLRVSDVMPAATAVGSVHDTDAGGNGYEVAPYTGAVYDPATNPFERLLVTKVVLTPNGTGIDLSKSLVTRWLYNGGSPVATNLVGGVPFYANNTTALNSAATWADVIGVSVLYTGTDTSGGGTIASGAYVDMRIDVQVRQMLRSQPTTLVSAGSVRNTAFTQVWDNVLDDESRYDSKYADISLVAATLKVSAAKTLSAASILESNRASDLTATLSAAHNGSTAASRQIVVEDTGADFWDAFSLRSLGTVTKPAGADLVRVDVQLDGSSTWTQGASSATAALPAGATASHVTGIRFVFTKTGAGIFSSAAPAATWTASAAYVVRLRDTVRSSGAAIPFPSTVSAPVAARSSNDDYPDATATGATSILLDTGTFRVDVEKRPSVSTTPAGETVTFSLIMTNTGTGYLDNPVVVDSLPVDAALRNGGPLLFDPTSELTFSTSSGGILPTTGAAVAYDDATRRVTVTWPAGSRLAPGEKYTIVVPLQVAPGLTSGYGAATNTMTVSSDRTLAACTNTSGNGKGASLGGANKACTTTNSVSTISASAISSFKGVKGDVDAGGLSTRGATNVNSAATACVPDAGGFYRSPCAANTVIGGTDLWKLQFTNGGNIPAQTATVVDVLPRSGDTYLRTGATRATTYAPVFAGGLQLTTDDLSDGTTYTWQVTTSANPCPNFATSDSTCSTGVTWLDGPTYPTSGYAAVRAIRVVFDFTAIDPIDDTLPPAASLALTYETVNTPSTSGSDGRAPVSVPVTSARAWNSFGVYATFGVGNASRAVEPLKAGVQLATGPVQVAKAISGDAAAFAPTSYQVTVSCTVAGATITLPAAGRLTLAVGNAVPYTGRIDGIPVGSVCSTVENTGGASSTSYSPSNAGGTAAAIVIGAAAASGAPVPADQRATVTNSYGTTSLRIGKTVTTDSTVGAFGPFDYTLGCTANSLTVPLAAGDAAFTLADGDERIITDLPVTATCELRETDADGATTISAEVNGGAGTAVLQNQAITIPLGTGAEYTAAITNHYAGGELEITKTIAGDASYADGPFTIDITCTYDGQTLFDGDLVILGGETKALAEVFPVGTSCALDETDAGGATSHTAASSVLIVAGTTSAGITNTFTTGTLRVEKAFTGPGKDDYGVGPFEAQVDCTWTKTAGGTPLTIPLPHSGVVELSSGNGYAASVSGLIAGADCTVSETKTGGATTSTVGTVSPVPAGGTSTVTITNDFQTGSLEIDKQRIGAGASRFGAGPFEVSVDCEYPSNGSMVAIDLGSDATQVLQADVDPDKDYRATIDGLLAGAVCSVEETDAGLAVSSALTPVDGKATIAASGTATVTVTNTFLIGQLEITKTASMPLVQGDSAFDYTLAVTNAGAVAAAGVTVADAIPATLKVTAVTVDTALWTSCAVTGKDVDGYGGDLECVYAPVLGATDSADPITLSVRVLPEIAQDQIANTAAVTSTTPVVDGDSDDETVDVKWLDVVATPTCVKDAPWLGYSVDAHNVDVAGRTMTVTWADALGTVIHTDSVPIAANGPVTGSLLWPGAAVNADGEGIAWPGWRDALPGEAPDWENLVLDPAAYGYGLRTGAQVTLAINPHTTITVQYPPATVSCAETPDDRDSDIWFTKRAMVAAIDPGDTFDYRMTMGNDGLGAVDSVVLVDNIPSSLKLITVAPQAGSTGGPQWVSCAIASRGRDGFGGTITCELDRPLGYQQVTPDVLLTVQLDPAAAAGPIVNTARVTAQDAPHLGGRGGGVLPTLALHDSAMVLTAGQLASTGSEPGLALQLGALLLLLGGILIAWRRVPRHRR